ncbi:DUF1653 domain-containing protein [Youxingia wuxianensis]|uniref:DUF1653 domain-containing protein n=1 Tax=Youxingia wuxianensis TaxID=2763678 RepID=A0A926IGD0_9FIRM|nr:DUF1653 domain-containing protein [Youxingia wuxianensis]MBC8584744.1 DUF1653 domain-containing protein [Youxingia wuxianensis]
MSDWVKETIFYHIYPLGFCGAPQENSQGDTICRIDKVLSWLPHLKNLGVNAIYFGPVFESVEHGYDTVDYYKIDRRLGTNEDFKRVCDVLHENGIRIVLDGVFNHVGRKFWAFEEVRKYGQSSPYCDWFANLNFGSGNPMGDPFWYESWQGHFNLVKLNLKNSQVVEHLLGAVGAWIEEFKIDGLRLDAADCVDPEFFKCLRTFAKGKKDDFWLMGEVIHGDYNQWANPEMLDSVTNYECAKGLYSSHNDYNYFEIAYSLNRQFGSGGIYRNIYTYNFVDNHDVNRLASMLKTPEHIYNTYTLLYTIPGVPSLYYGSEWGIKGVKQGGSDAPLRPCLELGGIPDANYRLLEHLSRLGEIRRDYPALKYGEYEQILVKNRQLVFKRYDGTQTVYVALNLDNGEERVEFKVTGEEKLYDTLHPEDVFAPNNGLISMAIPGYSARILVQATAPKAQKSVQPEKRELRLGRYRHFKGKEYEVLGIARHSETLEELVVYRQLYGEKELWIRPVEMFLEDVEFEGKRTPRFLYLGQ